MTSTTKPRKSLARRLLRILLVLLCVLVLLVAAVFVTRAVNLNRFPEQDTGFAPADPSDVTGYDLDVAGVEVEHITGDYLNGFHFRPEEKTAQGTVVVFGGSEGSPNFPLARSLAEDGYEVYALFFFGPENQRPELTGVPLEFFSEVLDRIEGGPVTVLGASKGAELAANLAVRYPDDIDHLVLIAPSAYTFPGLGREQNVSSFTWEGEQVPFVSFEHAGFGTTAKLFLDMALAFPVTYEPVYSAAVENAPAQQVEQARIKVEDFPGDILAVAGGDDGLWDSQAYAEEIARAHSRTTLDIHPAAGHVFGADSYMRMGQMVIHSGGTKEANEQAAKESNPVVADTLAGWHEKS